MLEAAKAVDGLPVDPRIVEEARSACYALRLIGKSTKRDRRPTADELARLFEFFGRRDDRSTIPMSDILDFAIKSARREAEITRLRREDLDEATHTCLLRDIKHPRQKKGNDRRFKLTEEAWAIVKRQPKSSELIFPYNPKSICAAFTRACQLLAIKDLHFHDMRHEATSLLFERGYVIHEVVLFTLHESWNDLKRYTQIRAEKVRELPAEGSERATKRARRRRTTRKAQDTRAPAAAGSQSVPPGPRSG